MLLLYVYVRHSAVDGQTHCSRKYAWPTAWLVLCNRAHPSFVSSVIQRYERRLQLLDKHVKVVNLTDCTLLDGVCGMLVSVCVWPSVLYTKPVSKQWFPSNWLCRYEMLIHIVGVCFLCVS